MLRTSIIFGLLVLPLLLPFLNGLHFQAFSDSERLLTLAGNSLSLAGLTLLIALPPAVLLAIALFRSNLFGRGFCRAILLVGLFIPLPVYVSVWQMAIGPRGWLIEIPFTSTWRPWSGGLFAAALMHTAAALPWLVLILGYGLQRTEAELEEDALTAAAPGQVLMRVTLRRLRPTLALAAVWLVAQTLCEIAVTDIVLVRTFAEEVYNQFVVDRDGLPAAMALSLPQMILLWAFALHFLTRWRRTGMAMFSATRPAANVNFAPRIRLWLSILLVVFVGGLAGIPLASLWRELSLATFSLATSWASLATVARTQGGILLDSIIWSGLAGLTTTMAAYAVCIAARNRPRLLPFLILLAVGLLVAPAPVLGFGLKQTIAGLVELEDALFGWLPQPPLRYLLYDGPSGLPVLWCHCLRFFPVAMFLLLPAILQTQREWIDDARMNGATGWGIFRHVDWPSLCRIAPLAVVVVAALSLGEIASSRLVEVPGRITFAQELFRQMHYGTSNTVAAFCVFEVFVTAALTLLISCLARQLENTSPSARHQPSRPGSRAM